MKSTAVVAAALMSFSATASAGTYLGMALGTDPSTNDGFASVAQPYGRSLRGLLGFRFGNVALEGALNGFSVTTQRDDQTAYQGSVGLKLSLPIGSGLEGFLRGGLERTWLSLDDRKRDFTGDGFLFGGGFEFRLSAILADASIFVDYTFHKTTLENDARQSIDATSGMWGLGVTVGL
ncbi:MAG TPA: outer membrane beta-barrel protein [Kofleriaceae bacterium]